MELAEQVEVLRARLVELVNKKNNFCDQEVITLSQELDVLLLLLQFHSKSADEKG
ncbi:aspartyl-phosphate phosphatase Spo0E family protein [Paenibacillus doosanensis]|uniref:Spo0E like sporulation regulatory protein n=1 Tax=Paenibacillus konkukensis TaxID=2020716 RepID=A0ABY4RVS6_9BACL|nr:MULTISPECIES: aspartyl-phosphate phosphatase Spo0E family protein [Paenibacillus]MCS7464367.1 aspartyl-phosphate phosphatase Spo0E family protein [Paenibacillus doosanensis]UQZ85864.1 Spo0E like sporulation regulatory protein [Paenibacillus konkukensis]